MNNISPSYKQTEVGVIPEDWEVKLIKTVCKLINGRGFKPFEWGKSGLPIIRIQNLNGSDEFNFYQGAYDKKLEIEAGQLLFAWSGSRGTSFGPHVWAGPRGLLNYHTWKVHIHESEIDKIFFFHALKQLTSFIEEKAHGAAALVHTQKWEMEGFEFPLPPTKAEQKAIAEALSDTDALIESLEQLIAKKHHLKQGAMQELLTGKKRLPGFSGELEVKRLGDIAPLQRGFDLPNPQLKQGPYPVVYSNGVLNQHKEFQVKGPGVVTGRSGTIGKVTFIEQDFWPHNTTLWVTNFNGNDPQFVFYLFTRIGLEQFASGSGVPTLNRNDVHDHKVIIPFLKTEQAAIAAVLSDMDAEIATLETKLAKTRQLKQGMMHKLLTGKIRLVPETANIPVVPEKKDSVRTPTWSHNWQINEAVIIAVLAKHFGSEQYPLARKRCTKLTYLLHRHVERKAEGYLKKAAGPYNPATRYKGPEGIAQKNGYVRAHHNGTYQGFVAAANIAQAEDYFQQWYGQEALAWLEQFRLKKTDELELLTTVDMAMEDLHREGKAIQVGTVKQVIHDHPEWIAKLRRELFSDINIARAMQTCRKLFA
jgi:type I restriction enzyme S subunit